MNIDKITYKTENHYYHKAEKTQIIIGGSLRKENYHIKRLEKKEYGKTKTWNTFTIDRKGKIYQHYNPKYYTDYMGIKEVDKKSISIVLENMGMLFYDYESEKYLNWIYEKCDQKLVFEKKWNNWIYWEKYTNKQLDSLVDLCKSLCEEYTIEMDSLGYNVYYDNTEYFEGIVTRSNYNIDYTDLNPSFDFAKFLKKMDIDYDNF